MKYIIIDTPIGELGFTFNDFITHRSMATSMEHLFFMDCDFDPGKVETVAGGFVRDGHCSGKSESLNLNSREHDDLIIKR